MEKKPYVKPVVEVIHLDHEDIITTSGGCCPGNHNNNNNHNHNHNGNNKPWNPWGWWPWHW